MNAKDIAATLHFGDRVNGITANSICFTGYLCDNPEPGRTAGGDHATIVRLASHPVPGRGAVWAITGTTRLNVLPVDPAIAVDLLAHLDSLRLDPDEQARVREWCTDQLDPLHGEH